MNKFPRRLRRLSVRLALIAVLANVTAVAAEQGPGAPVVITNVNLVTMAEDSLLSGHTILLVDGIISTLGPSGSIEIPDGATVIDGQGGFLIPGLWDMHVHIFGPLMESFVFPELLKHGVTGVRDMNGPISLDSIHTLNRSIESGIVRGPTIVAPGPLIDAPGRSPDEINPAIREVGNATEARTTVRDLIDRGAHFIKVYNRMTLPLLEAVLAEAAERDFPVAGHVPPPFAASTLSIAGMASQEHLQGILEESSVAGDEFRDFIAGTFSDSPSRETIVHFVELRTRMVTEFDPERASDLFSIFSRQGTAITPTLVSNRGILLAGIEESLRTDPRFGFLPEEVQNAWSQPNRLYSLFDVDTKREWYSRLISVVGQLNNSNVLLLAGTDLGVPWVYPGSSLHDELELMTQAGLSPRQALATATVNPTRYLGLTDRGTIETGQIGDFVLLGSNPLDDITAIRDIKAVLLRGIPVR